MVETGKDGRRFYGDSAFACRGCKQVWAYEEPEDLPYWLYIDLKKRNELPMPKLTPEIMAVLTKDEWR